MRYKRGMTPPTYDAINLRLSFARGGKILEV